jgi:hypothetical protein
LFHILSSSKRNFLRFLPKFSLKFRWKRLKNMIFCRYFCDIPCDISIKWTKKRAIFFCDCDMEKNPCDTLFYKLYHIAPALVQNRYSLGWVSRRFFSKSTKNLIFCPENPFWRRFLAKNVKFWAVRVGGCLWRRNLLQLELCSFP